MITDFIFASHSSHLFPCSPTDGMARIVNLLIELARAPFQPVWVHFRCILTPMPERENKPFELEFFCCQPWESNPGLLCSKQVRYPFHHCLSGHVIPDFKKQPRASTTEKVFVTSVSYAFVLLLKASHY